MSGTLQFLRLTLLASRRRVFGLFAFGAMFLAAGVTARVLTGGDHGHVELDPLFDLGGTTLVSALLLIGWLIGRFPAIAALVLLAGVFSHDRAEGYARLYAVRPRSLVVLYAARFTLLSLLAFLLSAILMPAFDLIVLGEWGGPGVFALIAGQVIVFGSITALLSTITRADAWVALFLGIAAIIWDALRRGGMMQAVAPPIREFVTVALPPQGAMLRIETAFGSMQAVPMDALLYIVVYGALVLLLAGVALHRREL